MNNKFWNWDEHPTILTKINPIPEQPDNIEHWEFRNGPDIAIVRVRNLHSAKFHDEIQVSVIEHGYKKLGNSPINPNRTINFTTHIIDEFNRMFFKSLEDIFEELVTKIPADATVLPFDYNSQRVKFYQGTTGEEILVWFDHHYRSFTGFCCKDFYDLAQKYRDTNGFLAKAIRSRYDI